MGGLVTRSAMVLNRAPVKKTAYLGVPHFGSPDAYFTLHPEGRVDFFDGLFKGLIAESLWDFVRKKGEPASLEAAFKGASRSWQSTYELLPDQYYFEWASMVKIVDRRNVELRWVEGLEKTYFEDLCRFDSGDFATIREALKFKHSLGRKLPGRPEDNLVIYSHEEDTRMFGEYLDYQSVFPAGRWGYFVRTTKYSKGGDGTVPAWSASFGRLREAHDVPGDHYQVTQKPQTFHWIHRLLTSA
jgi:hypothetical protein